MSFEDIKGQDKAIGVLREDLRQSRLAHGYLFLGPEGVGKKLVAKTLAKTVNCQQESQDSCNQCVSCLKIEKNQHPDVHLIDASTPVNLDHERIQSDTGNSEAIKINHIRQLQKDIGLRPYEGKQKIFIIDNAHNLTPAASNALLKILEEPPGDSLLILVSAKPVLLFKTIISRCRVVKFYSLTRAKLKDILRKDYSLDEHLAHFLAYFCEGRVGCALKLKDTDIMRDKNGVINQFIISKNTNLDDFSIKDRERLRIYLNILAAWFRDIYLIKIGTSYGELINLDRKTELLESIKQFSFSDLDGILKSISDSLLYLQQNVNVKLLLSDLRAQVLWTGQS